MVQVIGTLMDMGKAVDSLTGEMGDGGAKLLILWLGRLIECGADGVDTIHLAFIRAADTLAVVVDIPSHLGQALDILLFRPHFPLLIK
jgi:hypothetical protein